MVVRGDEGLRAGSDPPAAGRSWWQDLAMKSRKKIGHWIGGKATPGTSDRFGPVYNPATGEQSAAVALASAVEVSDVVATAAAAAKEWSASSLSARAAALFRLRELVDRSADELAALVTAEHGKVLSDAAGEVARGLENVEFTDEPA